MAITSTGGYIGSWYWVNTGVHPDFAHWGKVQCLGTPALVRDGWTLWAGDLWVIKQIINWRFYDNDY